MSLLARHGHDLLSPAVRDLAADLLSPEQAVKVIHEQLERQGLRCRCYEPRARAIGRP